jgi:hypothetical protein
MYVAAMVLAVLSAAANAFAWVMSAFLTEDKASLCFGIAAGASVMGFIAGYNDSGALAIFMAMATVAAIAALAIPYVLAQLDKRKEPRNAPDAAAAAHPAPPADATSTPANSISKGKYNPVWFYLGLSLPMLLPALASLAGWLA